jgi:hypothetical protein
VLDEGLLDQAVLERVVGHDDHPAADSDRLDRAGQCPSQHRQLVVDLDPERLEGALGGVSPGTPSGCRDRVPDELHEPGGPGERLTVPLPDDRLRDPSGEPLLAVPLEDPGQLLDRVGVEHVGRGLPLGVVHPHVERGVLGVGEAAVADVELHRGDTEVEQHPVHVVVPQLGEHLGDLVVHRVHESGAAGVRLQPGTGELEGVGVAVDADHVRLGAAGEDGLGVPAEAEGGVDQHRPRLLERRCH